MQTKHKPILRAAYLLICMTAPGRSLSFLFFIFSLSFFLSCCQKKSKWKEEIHVSIPVYNNYYKYDWENYFILIILIDREQANYYFNNNF